jgi:DNA polymerase V
MELIGLLDCNNFFVSCERLFRPDLQKKPVVVLSGNDGCVVARSNEVKDLGVPMGVPYFQVREVLTKAGATAFSSNFTLYRDISRRVMQTLADVVDTTEVYSIDEAFFTLSVPDEAIAREKLTSIKARIEQRVGVPVSLGAAASKTIAKYASEKEKRGSGVCVLIGAAWEHEQATVLLSDVWGIGRRLAERFRDHQLSTVADVRAADRMRIAKLFGVAGCRLYDELGEQPVLRVGAGTSIAPKSTMSSRSFKTATTSQSVVSDAISYHVHQAAADIRSQGLQCRYLQVLARPSRHSDWVLRPGSAECILTIPTNDTRTLVQEALRLFDSFYDPTVPYKKAGVLLGWLNEEVMEQGDLFGATTAATTRRPVMEVFDQLNRKFGNDAVTIGRLPGAGAWAPARDWLSPRYTTNWAEVPKVQA